MRRVCRVLDEPLCCARWPQQDGEPMGQKQAPPVSSHRATKSQNCTVWLWNVNGDKADIKQVKTLQTEKWKLPLKTTTQGMLGLVIFLVCLCFFSIQSLTQQWWKTAGWWLCNMKPSIVRKIQQEELKQHVSVAFPFLHLFWEDHLCREGHLPHLSDQLARKRAALPLPSVAPQENRLRLFAYFMMPWANRLLISCDPGWILIGNTAG